MCGDGWRVWWPSLCIRHPRHEAGVPEIVFRARKASVHPVAQLRADGEETTEVGRKNPAALFTPPGKRPNSAEGVAALLGPAALLQPHT